MKRALSFAVLVGNLLHSSIASAQEVRTDWVPLAKSLTVLLNEGWRSGYAVARREGSRRRVGLRAGRDGAALSQRARR